MSQAFANSTSGPIHLESNRTYILSRPPKIIRPEASKIKIRSSSVWDTVIDTYKLFESDINPSKPQNNETEYKSVSMRSSNKFPLKLTSYPVQFRVNIHPFES
eukprot:109721-Hanusia_phi.AAC.1